ncbi:MAG: hypothetical protein ACRD16_04810, partial [Thermoanaerobaculia bacterium]
MKDRGRFLLRLGLVAGCFSAAAGSPSAFAGAVRTITLAQGSCNNLPAIPVVFDIPADYVTRAPASGKPSVGCFWGTPSDLDRAMKDPKGIDFSSIQNGIFWARPAADLHFDRGRNQFLDGRGADEAAMKARFEKTGAKNAVVRRGAVGAYATLQFTGDLPAGPNHKAGRLARIYIATGNGGNTCLVEYHRPAHPTPTDDSVWQQFVSSLRS